MDMHNRNALRERFLRMGKKSNWFNRPSLADKIAELKKEVKPYGRTYHILNKSKTDFLFTNDRGRGLDGNDSACVIIDSDDGNDELDDENDNNSYANEDVKYTCVEIDGKNHSPIISKPKHIECVVIDSDDADDDLDCGSVCVDSIGNSADTSQDRSTEMDISGNDNDITNTKVKEDVVNGHTDSDDGNDNDDELDDDQHTASNDGNNDNDDKLDDDDQHTASNDSNNEDDDELADDSQHTASKDDNDEVDDNGHTNSNDEDDENDLDGYNDTEGMKYTCTGINGENDSPITRPKTRHREKGLDGNGSARGVIDSDDADDDLDSMDSVGNLNDTNIDHPSEMQLDICENNNHVTDKVKDDDGNGRSDGDHGSDDDHNELDDSKDTDSHDDDTDNNELVGDTDNEDVSYMCTGIDGGNDSPITRPKRREKGLDGNSSARGVIDSDDADDELNCGRVCVDSIGNLSDINQDRCTEIQLDISESNNCVTKTKEEVEVEDVDNGHTDSDNGSDELDDNNGRTDSNEDDNDDLDGDNDNEDVRYMCTGIDDRNDSPITRPKCREKGCDGNGSACGVIDSDDADDELECGRVCVDSIDKGNCSDVHQDHSIEIHLDISESNDQVTNTKEEVEEEEDDDDVVDDRHTDSNHSNDDNNAELDDDNEHTDSNHGNDKDNDELDDTDSNDDGNEDDDLDGDNENEDVRYTCIGINSENDSPITRPKHSNNNHSSSNAVEDASPRIISESPFKASTINYSSSYAIEDASHGTSGSPLKVSMNSSSNTVEDASPGISESPLKASLTARLFKKYNPEKSETDVEDFELFLQKVRTPKQSGLSGEKKKREASLNEFIVDDDEVDQEDEDVFYDDPGFIPELEELSDDDKENDCIEITTPASSIASFKTPRSTTSSTPFKTPKSRTLSSNSSCPKSVLDSILNPYSTEKDFRKSKDKLVRELFELYNRTVFDNQLPSDFQITWNPRMRSTAGFCYYSKKNNIRMARIELADKVIDSADRLRDTLIHEMCHAAAWMISGIKAGHGTVWKKWTLRANSVHQDLPPISRCHSYTINAKYTYRCTNNACANSFGRHSKSVNLEKSRCAYCHSRLELVPQLKKDGTPQSRTPNRFALFVKQNYARIKSDNDTFSHQEVMKALSTEFTKLSTS